MQQSGGVTDGPAAIASSAFALIWSFLQDHLNGVSIAIAGQTTLALTFLLVAIIGFERTTRRRDLASYAHLPCRTDVIYTFMIVGGIYGWIQQPLINAIDLFLRNHTPFLYLNALSLFPFPLRLVVFLGAVDFCRYWKHRWLHTNPLLQTFHAIHHAPDNLNILATYRIHLCEYLLDGVATLVPVVLLGIPPVIWLPLYFILILYGALAHSGLDISFGPLDHIFVSPRFHATHHSADRRDYDANFGALFSFWDVIFGTANFPKSTPQLYGLPRLHMPASFHGQFVFPAKLILRAFRGRPDASSTVER